MEKYNYYIDGNTVQKEKTVTEKERKKEESFRAKCAKRKRIEENRKMSMSIGRTSLLFYLAGVITIAFMSVDVIKLQSSTTILSRQVSNLQNQVESLRSENNNRYKSLPTTINLNEIKERAAALGMHPQTDEQIIYYEVDSSNYMDQYLDIPEK